MFYHVSIMLSETIDYLDIKEDGAYVDCTLGGTEHVLYLLNQSNDKDRLIAVGRGLTAIENAKGVLEERLHKVTFIHNNFRELTNILNELEIERIDDIYCDLGVSSPQLDVPERGFSHHNDAKLDMRMDQARSLSTYEIVNQWPYEALVRILLRYGEERFSKQIVRRIEAHRGQQPTEATSELVDIIEEGVPAKARQKGGHPARRVFQAIRIAVNDELSAFGDSVKQAIKYVKVESRISVITFHSSENRLCKQIFQEFEKGPDVPRSLPVIPEAYTPKLKRVNCKSITATDDDLNGNNRARSVKLRIVEILR